MLEKRYYILSRKDIGYLRFILESYDGLLFMRTIDAKAGLVEVGYHPSRRDDALRLLQSLAEEVGLEQTDPPENLETLA
ncbi:MAG: hypothetical protein PWP34_495 [Desulfuromonadales bacterium]|nr:hypothetical protein [Desulfuromonadales bacterium]